MKKIYANKVDSNNESYYVANVMARTGSKINKSAIVGVGETTKVTFEIEADADGYIFLCASEGDTLNFDEAFAVIFSSLEELTDYVEKENQLKQSKMANFSTTASNRLTKKAMILFERHNLDLINFPGDKLITEKDIQKYISLKNDESVLSEGYTLNKIQKSALKKRLLIVGSGMGATQVLDMLDDEKLLPIGFVDDDISKLGKSVMSLPVLGNCNSIESLLSEDYFDVVVISVSTSIEFRVKINNLVKKLNLELANVIDKSVRISKLAEIGKGNIICFGSQIANNTKLGDNNFISSYNSFDHHNFIGSNISTGPGCMTSGLVTIEDEVRMGTGIYVEPYIKIGSKSIVSSGSIVRTSIPEKSIVKNKIDYKVVNINRG